jgi:tetratricopeptide (TPR) repeat protein
MAVQVRENTIEEMEVKLTTMSTALNKIIYLESALKVVGGSFDIKRFLWRELAGLYEERKMFERAARALATLASIEPMFKDRMDSYVMAAEMFCRIGKIVDAEDMFTRVARDAGRVDKEKVVLARKNIYFGFARNLEEKGKRASAVKFYEQLIKMRLEMSEKEEVVEKLKVAYKALGMFREARLLG